MPNGILKLGMAECQCGEEGKMGSGKSYTMLVEILDWTEYFNPRVFLTSQQHLAIFAYPSFDLKPSRKWSGGLRRLDSTTRYLVVHRAEDVVTNL
jgi:hypothetical protein